MRTVVAATAMIAVLAACESSTSPQPDPVEWTAELAGLENHDGVEGEVVVSSTLTSFQAEIVLAGLAAGEYEWELAAGTCEDPAARIGAAAAYEQLVSDDEGEASASATVNAVLQSTAAYHVAVFTVEQVDEEGVRTDVACGDLERT